MKKNIGILCFLLLLCSTYFGIQLFNLDSSNRASYFEYNDTELLYQEIEASNTDFGNDRNEFFEKFNQLATDEEVSVYVCMLVPSSITGKTITTLYVSSNDIFLKDNVLVDLGYYMPTKNDSYNTLSKNLDTKLSSILAPSEFEINNLMNKQEIGGTYSLKPHNQGDYASIDRLLNRLETIYPQFNYIRIVDVFSTPSYFNSNVYILNMFMICCLLTLVLCSTIFGKLRKIGIEKMEGHSNLSIYMEYFLKPFLIFSTIGGILVFVISMTFYPVSKLSFEVLSKCILDQYCKIILIQLCTSLSLYIMICFIPITVSIKGKNNLLEIEVIAYILKLGVSFMILPIFLSGYDAIADTIQIVKNHSLLGDKLDNMYTFNSEFYSEYFNFNDKSINDRVLQVQNEFEENNELFSFLGGFISDAKDSRKLLPILTADKNYLIQNELIEENNLLLQDNLIFIRNDTKFTHEEINTYKNALESGNGDNPVHVLKYDKKLLTYRPLDMLYSPFVEDQVIIYNAPTEDIPRLNGSIFIYKDDNPQGYVDSVFTKFGFDPAYSVVNPTSNYEGLYQYRLSWNAKIIIPIVAIFISYILITRLLVEVNFSINLKKLQIRKTEGYFNFPLSNYLLVICSPILIATIVLKLFNKIYLTQRVYFILLILLLIEFVIYCFNLIFYKKKMRIRL